RSATCPKPARNWHWDASASAWPVPMRGGCMRCTSPSMPTDAGVARLSLLLALLLSSFAAAAQARIGVATMQPGEIFFERFGHNAIVVDDPALGEPVSYNFGFFDMAEDGFVGDFVHGHM